MLFFSYCFYRTIPYYSTVIQPLINTNMELVNSEESGIEDIEDSGQINEKYWF